MVPGSDSDGPRRSREWRSVIANTDPNHDFWQQHARHYDRVVKGVFGGPVPRALELTAAGVEGAGAVLEVAAGTGLVTAVIAPRVRRVVAVDYSENMLAILRDRMTTAGISNVEVVHGNIYELGYPSSSFDIVVAANVLHLVPHLEPAIDALRHVLRPGGKLISPTFVHDETVVSRMLSRLLVRLVNQPTHRRLSAASLAQALEARGLRIARSETIPGLIPIAYVESVLEAR